MEGKCKNAMNSISNNDSTDCNDVEILTKELNALQNKYVNIKKLEVELQCSKEDLALKRNKLQRMVGCFHNKQDRLLKSSVENVLSSIRQRITSYKTHALNQDDLWTNSAKHRTIRRALRNVKRNACVDEDHDHLTVQLASKLQRQIKFTYKAKRIKEEIETIKSASEDVDKFWAENEKVLIAWFKDVNTALLYLQEKCGAGK